MYVDTTRDIVDILVEVIGAHEGFRAKKYKDTKGIWTIGYGFNLESGTFEKELVDRWKTEGISKKEADLILRQHIIKIRKAVHLNYPWVKNLTPAREIAVMDLTFNMGIGWFKKFTNTLLYLQSGRYASAKNGLLSSAYAKQVGIRARENAYAFAFDKYPVPFTEKTI